MILESFGQESIGDGVDAATIEAKLQDCVGKQCAILLVAQQSKTDPSKSYHNILDDWNVKSILPLNQVGKIYEGELKKNITQKPQENKPQETIPF